MSKTYSLVCHESRSKIWIGQSPNGAPTITSLYYGEPETMERLTRFLAQTMGKPLVLLCDDTDDSHLDYDEFEPATL